VYQVNSIRPEVQAYFLGCFSSFALGVDVGAEGLLGRVLGAGEVTGGDF